MWVKMDASFFHMKRAVGGEDSNLVHSLAY
jgi:hypothetical protein